MKYYSAIFMILNCLILTACSSLSKQECRRGDWAKIGYKDGVNGRTPNYISRHNKACAKMAIIPNHSIWEKNRQEGLKLYCTTDNLYLKGRQGLSMSPVCPPEQRARLLAAHQKGKRYYDLSKKIDDNISKQEYLIKKREDLSKKEKTKQNKTKIFHMGQEIRLLDRMIIRDQYRLEIMDRL